MYVYSNLESPRGDCSPCQSAILLLAFDCSRVSTDWRGELSPLVLSRVGNFRIDIGGDQRKSRNECSIDGLQQVYYVDR